MLPEGKSAMIIGAEGGIGRVARTIARAEARVFLAVRPQELVRLLQRSRRPLLSRTAGPRSQSPKRGIGDDVESISNAPLTYLALGQVPPRGVWNMCEQTTLALTESWFGRPGWGSAHPARNDFGPSED
jgi:NAD(P)-dependent dehydrogenase (short-subunit alcohol dehydrogenase family)